MQGPRHLLAGCAAGLILLAGCATPEPPPPAPVAVKPPPRSQGRIKEADLQCVPFARAHSNVKLFGDAYLWWGKAKGHYTRRASPSVGSVMVLDHYSGHEHAHLAVVRSINPKMHQIIVDHANWLNDGNIHLNDAVRDVSRAQNWTEVRVFDLATHQWGRHDYHVAGFIGPDRAGAEEKPPQSISDLISYLSPDDLPRTTVPGIHSGQKP